MKNTKRSEISSLGVLAIVLALVGISFAIINLNSNNGSTSTNQIPANLGNGNYIIKDKLCSKSTTENSTVIFYQTTANLTVHVSATQTVTNTIEAVPFNLQNATTETDTLYQTSSTC